MGPPNRKIRYNVFYRQGIDNYGGWLKLMKNYKVVKQSGPVCNMLIKKQEKKSHFQVKIYKHYVKKTQISKNLCIEILVKNML